jgi:ABC-type polysaccharide/polyol phosphate export permease
MPLARRPWYWIRRGPLRDLDDLEPVTSMAMSLAADVTQSKVALKARIESTISAEIIAGFRAWPIWTVMGWDDIRQRYRRSVLGPFWITLSMAIFILILGEIYSHLFHMQLATYLPFLTVGYILWGFISTSTVESCRVFQEGSHIIKQIKLPYSVYVLRLIWRNFIVFAHTIVIYIPVAIFFKIEPTITMLYLVPGIILLVVNQIWVTMLLGILSTRYRDIQPIVTTAIQLAMFATPIMWPVSSLGSLRIVAEINPIYHLIEINRAPLLGTSPELRSWLIALGLAVAGSGLAAALLVRTARRIVFWL